MCGIKNKKYTKTVIKKELKSLDRKVNVINERRFKLRKMLKELEKP